MPLLDVASLTVVAGGVLLLIYELIALVLGKVNGFPTITSVVRPWVANHPVISTSFAALWVAGSVVLFLHFKGLF